MKNKFAVISSLITLTVLMLAPVRAASGFKSKPYTQEATSEARAVFGFENAIHIAFGTTLAIAILGLVRGTGRSIKRMEKNLCLKQNIQ